MSTQQDIRISEDAAALAQRTADKFVRLAQEDVATLRLHSPGHGA
jgi:hypothetical protein